jgi:NAD(P)H dehydrogenase (quinone)
MKTIAVVYHSGFGNTATVAQHLARGARTVPSTRVLELPILEAHLNSGRWNDPATLEQLHAADAIVFGAPTYMGMVSAPFKAFADATAPLWMTHAWQDKLAGGFTTSSHPSGDKVMTLHYLITLAAQLRMVWVGPVAQASHITGSGEGVDQWGYYLGVGALGTVQPGVGSGPTPGDLRTAELYGERIARAALCWNPTATQPPSLGQPGTGQAV